MTLLERAVVDIAAALESMKIDYMIIGGATEMTFGDRPVRIITPEDLVLMKIISDRPRDLADAEALVRRRVDTLDRAYLEPRIREFAESLEMPDILANWKRWVEAD
jgi:hypothetical protein